MLQNNDLISIFLSILSILFLVLVGYFMFPDNYQQNGYQRLSSRPELHSSLDASLVDFNPKHLRSLRLFTVSIASLQALLFLSNGALDLDSIPLFLLALGWIAFAAVCSTVLKSVENAVNGGVFVSFLSCCLFFASLVYYLDLESFNLIAQAGMNLILISTLGFFTFTTSTCQSDTSKSLSPEHGASILSKLFFSFVNPMINEGNKKSLDAGDLPQVVDQEKAEKVVMEYQDKKELYSSLAARILSINAKYLAYGYTCSVIASVAAFASPFFLYRIVECLQTPGLNRLTILPLLFELLFFSMLRSIADGQTFFVGRRVGNRCRIVLIHEIFEKSLKRAIVNMQEQGDDAEATTQGKIVTLMSVDAVKIQDLGSYSHEMFIKMPISIVVSISALYSIIGWSAFVGIAVVLLIAPISHLLGKLIIVAQERMLKFTDKRVSAMTELLNGIRIVKYFAWESHFKQKIDSARYDELKAFVLLCWAYIGFGVIGKGTGIIIAFCTFYVYVMIAGHELDAATAFTTISLLEVVRSSLVELPVFVLQVFKAKVSLDRIENFLKEQEVDGMVDKDKSDNDDEYSHEVASNSDEGTFKEENVSFGFKGAELQYHSSSTTTGGETAEEDGSFTLRNLTVEFPLSSLTLICGPTGSGKTGLLLALLGELKTLKGHSFLSREEVGYKTEFTNNVAYAAQSAWLLNATVRDNILFGEEFDSDRYKSVVQGCALVKDFENLEGGDLTEIGEKGINLSGGQKQRISLARACYSRSSTVFLDDPLSAVDAPTARYLLHKAILGLLRDRTVILVSHATHLVAPFADYVVQMNNGEILMHGPPQTLVDDDRKESLIYQMNLERETFSDDEAQVYTPTAQGDGTTLVKDEEKSEGSVSWSVYSFYFVATGGLLFLALFFGGFLLSTTARVLNDWWLAVWTNKNREVAQQSLKTLSNHSKGHFVPFTWTFISKKPSFTSILSDQDSEIDTMFYLSIYAAFGLTVIFTGLCEDLITLLGGLWGARKLHNQMLDAILYSPLRFFDTTPIGRVLNRFSSDLSTIDNYTMYNFQIVFSYSIRALTVIGVIASVAPVFLIAVPFIIIGFVVIAKKYLNVSRDLKRLEAITRSPIYSQFSEALAGVSTIRSYGSQSRFLADNLVKIDSNQRPFHFLWVTNRWLCIRIEFFSNFVIFCAGVAIIFVPSINPGWAALMIVYSFEFTDALLWTVRLQAEMEMAMNSVERIQEYCSIEKEDGAQVTVNDNTSQEEWIRTGEIKVQDLSIRYAEDLPDVLKNVSFACKGASKVAIVGRTGAGKSTLSLAFFRMIPISSGKIVIDGHDISELGLHDLRSSLTMIPQDPVLFTGTIRSNIDPLSMYDDAKLWDALERVHFIESLQQSTDGDRPSDTLDLAVSENGSNFSQGQRQLLCLARSILQRNKVIFLDEATSSTDNRTDARIQLAIRSEFKESTILCIAHRIRTVIDFDLILVLDKGQVAEYGSPIDLLENSKVGLFKDMCLETGEYSDLLDIAKKAIKL